MRCEGIALSDGGVMKKVDETGYKYLGVLEGADIMQRQIKEKVKGEYSGDNTEKIWAHRFW